MNYTIGDKVKVKEGLEVFKKYGGFTFIDEMAKYSEITINYIGHKGGTKYYISKEGHSWTREGYFWTDEMLDGLIEENIKYLNIIEVLQEKVGTKFTAITPTEFKYDCWIDKDWDDNKVIKYNTDVATIEDIPLNSDNIKLKFIKKEDKPYTFMEICAIKGDIRFRVKHLHITQTGYDYLFDRYMDFDKFLIELRNIFTVENEKRILSEGKFYLQEELDE